MGARGRRTAPGGPAEPAWPGPGARAGRGGSSGARTLLPGLCLHPLAHLPPQSQTRPRGLCSLTPHLWACVCTYIHVCACMKNLTCFSFDHVRGYFPANHHQAHLGHSLTPLPAAALSGPQSWRDPSHCAAQQGAGGALRLSAPLRASPRGRSAPRSAGGPGSALFSSPLPHLLRGHRKRVSKPACLARYQTRTFSSVLGGWGVPFRADAGWLWSSGAVCPGNSILPAVAGFNCIHTATEVSLNASTQRSLSGFPVETITVRSKTFKSCRA